MKIAVIVDAYSTGAKLANEFKKYDIRCVHVKSSANIGVELTSSFEPKDFHHAFEFERYESATHLGETIATAGSVVCVVPGTETGVVLADELNEVLGTPGNESQTSHLRRNKFEMHEILKTKNLSRINQASCKNIQEVKIWALQQNNWPIVVKPVSSAGADGVIFCKNQKEIEIAAEKSLGKINKIGEVNEAVVLQERILGQQFIVNAVSLNGEHYVCEVWRDDKIPVEGASLICDREILLNSSDRVVADITSYAKKCLDCLGVKNGPSHTELFLTECGETVLIETAARMQGTIDHDAVIAATGQSHVTLTVMRYAAPQEFTQIASIPYQKTKHLHCITLNSKDSGIVLENITETLLRRLPSFHSLIGSPAEGEIVRQTTDLFTNIGIVYLLHNQEKILNADYQIIRKSEESGELMKLQ